MPDATPRGGRPSRRLLAAGTAAVLVLGAIAFAVVDSLLPKTYNMADMGYADFGGGPQPVGIPASGHHHGHADTGGAVGVDSLVAASTGEEPAVRLALSARAELVTLPDGRQIDGYTLNGSTPGPLIEAVQGDLVEVTLTNENIPAGVTLHWHGLDVPNGADGVAGVTQDAVAPGASYTYRFYADQVGTYWYHSHQQSHPQVVGGLFGGIVVRPSREADESLDVPALVHFYNGVRTINGQPGETRVDASPGQTVRVRIVNTDQNHMPVWVTGGSFRLLAVDGSDVNGPTPVTDQAVLVAAGGRADLEVTAPADGSAVRVQFANASLVVGGGQAVSTAAPASFVDLLSYGTPGTAAFDPATADRTFEYQIGRVPGLLNGRPGLWWIVNGGKFPNVPMYMVAEGDKVIMRVSNTSGEAHPMHLHGHHVRVLSRNGVPATGSPWVVDSLQVENGASYEVAFIADNPGIWMDHCHNLPHAAEGLMTHLAYIGYATPFVVGGDHANHPE